jgi:hypothetical protein
MAKSFNSMKDLEKYINQQIKDSLEKDVSEKVIDIAKRHVETDVYNVYKNPKEYERTGKLKESFESTSIENGIEIENTRRDGNREIAEIIEHGHDDSKQGYEYPAYYPQGENFIQARPFIQNTKDEIVRDKVHVDELKKSMKSKGIDIE